MISSLGHYNLQRSIGKGAMGEVYLAEDTKLDRRIALKVLPPELADNPDRLARFKREAKAAAAITHPGIVTLHAIEEATDETGQTVHFLTMELVDGKTLSDCIEPEGLPLKTLLDWGVQLADALAGAHAEGIIHRDLKPANIMVTTSDSAAGDSTDAGRLKILDFGLARPAAPSSSDIDHEAPTAAESLTQDGRILGTPAYMSPEQAEGSPVDHRTDIFSLGIVLFELAVGKRPFAGTSSSGVISAILRDEPASLTELKPEIPVELARIVRRCLQKDRNRRFQTALDVRNELDELRQEVVSGTVSGSRHLAAGAGGGRRSPLLVGLVVSAVAAAVTVAILTSRTSSPEGETSSNKGETSAAAKSVERGVPVRLTNLPGRELFPRLTSDGRSVIFAGEASGDWDIYLQRVGGKKVIELTPDFDGDDTMPALSPDDQLIAFRSERDGGGLFVMGATGESIRRVSDFGYNPSWSPDARRIVFATVPIDTTPDYSDSSELWIVDIEQSEPKQIIGAQGADPTWSPNGHRIAYLTIDPKTRDRDIVTIAAEGGEPVAGTGDDTEGSSPSWSPDGRYLYFRLNKGGASGIARLSIDERTGRVDGDPVALTHAMASWHSQLSVANGQGAYVIETIRPTMLRAEVKAASHEVIGTPRVVLSETVDLWPFDVSADDTRMLCMVSEDSYILFTVNTDGTDRRDIRSGRIWFTTWSPDEQRIAFIEMGEIAHEIYTMRADGSDVRLLSNHPQTSAAYPVWSPDGRRIAYWHVAAGQAHLLDPSASASDQKLEPIVGGEGLQPSDWSADGERLLGEHVSKGIVYLDLTTGEQHTLGAIGKKARWLGDSAIVFLGGTGIQLLRYLDLESRVVRPLLGSSDDPSWVSGVAVAPGGNAVYYTDGNLESDIYLMNIE